MKSRLFGAATIAALSFGLQPAMAQAPIKIGFVSTFSGPQAAIGEDMRRSVELAKEHLGGKMGGRPIEIIYEDDQFKPDVGKQRSEKLVQQDKVNFVAGYIWSNVLLASLKTVTDEGDTILISSNAGPSQIAGELCNKNFFSTSWQNDQTPMAMGDYLQGKGVPVPVLFAGAGERAPRVVTRDNTDEPRNRRADYTIALAPPRLPPGISWLRLP
jgi:branched-chain amino acid transport system substrate-binding protein